MKMWIIGVVCTGTSLRVEEVAIWRLPSTEAVAVVVVVILPPLLCTGVAVKGPS